MSPITNTLSASATTQTQGPSEIMKGDPIVKGDPDKGTPAAIVSLSKDIASDMHKLDNLRENFSARLADAKNPAAFKARHFATVAGLEKNIHTDVKALRSDLKKIDLRA